MAKYMISEDGVNGSVTITEQGLERINKKRIGRDDRSFIPWNSINSVGHNRKSVGRDRVMISIGGASVEWKIAGDAEGFVNAVQQMISRRAHSPTYQQQPAPAPAPAPQSDLTAELANLAQLHRSGALSAQEFAAAKARLLGGSVPQQPPGPPPPG